MEPAGPARPLVDSPPDGDPAPGRDDRVPGARAGAGAGDGEAKSTAGESESPDADGAAAPTGADGDAASPAADPKEYAARLRELLPGVEEKVLATIEQKLTAKQGEQMGTLGDALGYLSLLGFGLLFLPLALRKKHPGRMGALCKYSALAAVLFVVAVNLYATTLLLLRGVQGAMGSTTNPQVAITRAAFANLVENAEEIAMFGPSLLEPTLAQLAGGSEQPVTVVLLENVQKLANDLAIFGQLASFFQQLSFLFAYLPVVLTLVALVLFVLAAKPTLVDIVKLPDRAASGQPGVARQVVKETFRRIGRELLATLCVLGVFVGVTVLSALLLAQAVKPAVEAFLAYLFASFIYVQVVPKASTAVVLIALGGTAVFLILNMAAIVVSSALFLGKAQKAFQQRFHDRRPLRSHARLWTWGTLSLVWVQALPVLYILGAQPLVEWLIERMTKGASDPGHINWSLLLTSGPVILVVLFLVAFWAARGLAAIKLVAKYPVKLPAADGAGADPFADAVTQRVDRAAA